VATFFASVLGLMSVSTRRERALLGGLAAISALMGFNARPDAPAYLVLAGLLAAVLSFSFKNLDRRIKLSILILSSLGALFVVWRYVYPLFTALRGIDFGVGQNAPTLQGLMFNVIRLPDLFVGAFGQWGLGWIDTPTPSSVWAVTFGIYVAVVFSSMKFFDRRQSIAAGLALLALIVVPLQFLWANNLSVGQIVQPRYLLPMIVLLAASSLHRKSTDIATGFSRGQIWAIGFGLFVANTLALHTNLRRYITGLDINQISLNFEMEWWWVERPASDTIFWFSPNYLWVAGSIAFGLLLISIWKLRSEIGLVDSKPQIKSQVNN
jgi:fumarate reductase subunit D